MLDMSWYAFLGSFLAVLLILLILRVPVAFAMLGTGALGALVVYGDVNAALNQIGLSILGSVTTFTFTAIPLFILMGELMFRSQVAQEALDELSIAMRRMPGRLAMVAVGGGAAFGLLSGSTLANTALFGRTLLPDMERRGYDQRLAVGSILAAGGLAMVLPPSALAILWGGVAQVPIGPLLIAGIVPGLMMTVGYVCIIWVWSRRGADGQAEDSPKRSLATALGAGVRRALGPGVIVVAVLGTIFLGVATPTEAAAIGAVAALLLGVVTRRLTWQGLYDSAVGTVRTTTMIFAIVLGSTLYAQLMSFSGATSGLVSAVTGTVSGTFLMLLVIMVVLLVLGAFIDQVSIMLVTAPLFMPIVTAFGWDPVWFSVLLLINLQIANTTPPFGMSLFVMKGVAPHLKMSLLYRSVLPWIVSDLVVITILAVFPDVVLFLPGFMGS
ncbi:TRAP transporter large permease [Janibacter corallicola]|uniref:TRAP transporter large permease n=1 Tax=Janibacter corallicola TaxID=415212 RepID=UPI000B023191|nr:TRAP transporter large permease subunit [Janibacter corallicola]